MSAAVTIWFSATATPPSGERTDRRQGGDPHVVERVAVDVAESKSASANV